MSPTCILVVDSDRTYQDHLGKKLKSLGFSVQSASGAGEVLARLDEHAPDVVLIDEMVKDLTPGRLLEEIQNRDLDAFTIVMAKDANLDRGMRWVVSGAFACLSKPLEMPDLLRAIAKGLENKDAFHRVVSMAQELTATNHALLEEKASLNEKTEELRFLYHLASQLSATLDPRQIAGIIGRALSKLVGASPVLFMTAFDPPGNLRCYPDRKINPELAEDLARELLSQFTGTNKDLRTEPIIMETNSARRLLVRKPKHKVTLPLVTAGKQAGIMGVYFFRPPDLSQDRRLLLASVALQAAQALFNAYQHQKALNMAAHDPLTGLINRRAFDEILRREFKIFQRYGSVMSLIMIDLDHFKTINDRFGHEAGDQVLRTVARIIKDNVRDTDHAARVGGEEFAVILPNTEEREAWRLSIRIQRALRRTSFPLGQFPWRQTVSQGVADTRKTPVKDGENLLRLADQAMYMAKEEGRNKIRLASALEFSGSGKEKRYAWK